MYQLNSPLSFNEEQLLAHIPPEHTGDKYNVNKLRCMNYIAKHYTSLGQQIHNTYEIEQDFFFFCTPKTIFSLFFWSDSPNEKPAFVAISIDSEKTKSLGSPYYNIELHCASLKFLFDDVMPTLSKYILEICSNLREHFTTSPDEINFLTLYTREYIENSLIPAEFNLKMMLPMFLYSHNVCICSYMKQYGNDLLFNKPFQNAPLFLENFYVTHLFHVCRGRKTLLMQLYYNIRDVGAKLCEAEIADNLVNSELGISTIVNNKESPIDQLYVLINALTDKLGDLRSYTFSELKPYSFGIPFKYSLSQSGKSRNSLFEEAITFPKQTKTFETCFVQSIFAKFLPEMGLFPDERYIGMNRLMHIEAINNYIDNYNKHKPTIYENLSRLSQLIQENPSEYDVLIPYLDKIEHFAEKFNEIDTKLNEELELILSNFKDIEVI